jgi:arylsulfatase A-like enzyme
VNAGRRRLTQAEHEHLVRLYDGNLAYVDREVGHLRRMLEGSGVWDRTVLILTADHGEELLEHGRIGHGQSLYDESLHIPLIVRFPRGTGRSGARVRELVDLLDVAPTIAEIFGVSGEAAPRSFEGRSLLGIAAGAPGQPAVFARSPQERPSYSLYDGAFKLVHSLRNGSSELYDLGQDPGEQHDIAARQPIRVEFYRQWLYRWVGGLRRERATAPDEKLAPAELEALRALGYVQ